MLPRKLRMDPSSESLHIGLVIEHFRANRGGAERWTSDFAGWLLEQGHHVHVFARDFDESLRHAYLSFHAIDPGATRCRFAELVEEATSHVKLDVLHDCGCGWHCNVMQPHGGSRAAYLQQYLKLKPAATRWFSRLALRFAPRYRDFNELAKRQFGSKTAIYIALSNMVANHFQSHHGIPSEQIRIIYNGVDLERFAPESIAVLRDSQRAVLGIESHETCLLMVAHNLKLKGAETLLRAASNLENVCVLIVGSKRFSRYERLARRLNLKAIFSGAVDDPLAFYAAADIYIQPTFYDPCSLVVLEALASGLPVITTRFNGAGELLTEGREGFVIDDPSDYETLACKIRETIVANSDGGMKLNARELASANSQERNFREMLVVYQEHLRGS